MSDISEEEWKLALISIVEELDDEQFNRMLFVLKEIPGSQKKLKFKGKMAQKILERYGLEDSISVIKDAMNWVPRMDATVQNLLRPFVDKLKNKHENGHIGLKRNIDQVEGEETSSTGVKRKNDSVEEKEMSSTGLERNIDQVEGEETSSTGAKIKNESVEEEEMPSTDRQKSCQPDKETKTHPWKKSICDLKPNSQLCDTDGIMGKVVQKSALRTYYTKDSVKKFFFYLAIADETGTMKVMVYGKKRDKEINEGKSYLFRELIKNEIDMNSVKVTTKSKVSETKTVKVSEEHEMEAQKLIYPETPLYSIAEAKSFADKTEVSVEGTVTKIDPVRQVTVQQKEKIDPVGQVTVQQKEKVNVQDFQLQDDTGSIMISMWRDNTKQAKGLSVGDIIKIANMKTNQYYDDISLDSTGFTKIHKVRSVGVQNVKIEIIGIAKATKKETHLDAEVIQQPHRLVVGSPLLAKAFGLDLGGSNLKESFLEKLPLFAEAIIHGGKIKKITAVVKEMYMEK